MSFETQNITVRKVDGQWFYELSRQRGSGGPFRTSQEARRAAEHALRRTA